ncbi:MAG: hypothetical protein JW888_00320 [Pirellulales bacterium]|nr:hypothetical protein [Pirellulales bacterium]
MIADENNRETREGVSRSTADEAGVGPPGEDSSREYAYRLAWWEFVGRLPFGAVVLLGLPWYLVLITSVDEAWRIDEKVAMVAASMATALIVLILFWRSARLIAQRLKGGQHVAISRRLLESPQQSPSTRVVQVALENVTRIRLVQHVSEAILHIEFGKRDLCIPDGAFSSEQEWNHFLETLSEATGLTIDRHAQRFGQFSLGTMLLLTALVAMILGLNRGLGFTDDTFEFMCWRGLLLLAAFSPLVVLLSTLPRVGRPAIGQFIGVAYTLGFLCESTVGFHVVRYVVGYEMPPLTSFYAWYPLTFPLTRFVSLFVPAGYGLLPVHFLPLAAVVSGVLFGLAAWFVWRAVRRRRANGRKSGTA